MDEEQSDGPGPRAFAYSTDQAIRFFQTRIQQNPNSAADYAFLGDLFARKGRETGDLVSYGRGEYALRKALALSPNQSNAQASLAVVLCEQHRFTAGLELARQVYRKNPRDLDALATMGDAALELGDYPAAEDAYQKVFRASAQPAALARLAHLAELKGNPAEALRLLRRAAADAREAEQDDLGWFLMRLGNCLAGMGRADEAEASYREALRLNPRDYRTLASLTRLAAGRGDWRNTLAWGERAGRIVPMPETIGLVGDALTALGNPKEARKQYALVDAIAALARAQGGLYDRQQILFDADHERHLDEALALARRERKARQDIYAHDLLAWVCFRKGLLAEAQAEIERAMVLGTRDASLDYHAGRIAAARGDPLRAKELLTRALAINPYFHPFAPRQAREILAKLEERSNRGGAATKGSLPK